jgi:hypothetical protein
MAMGMKANEIGNWLRQQHAGKRDHRELMPEDYVVLRPGPKFDWLMGDLAAGQPTSAAPEPNSVSDDKHEDNNRPQQFSP